MPKYYQACYRAENDKIYHICDTSQTTVEKKAKKRVVDEKTAVYVEAVEIAAFSLKGFVNILNMKEKPLSRELLSVFTIKETDKGFRAKRVKIGKQKKRTENIEFHPDMNYLEEFA
jgi:hypothetical protein